MLTRVAATGIPAILMEGSRIRAERTPNGWREILIKDDALRQRIAPSLSRRRPSRPSRRSPAGAIPLRHSHSQSSDNPPLRSGRLL
ncbi:hypothetical protein GCM10010231_29020 [Streptomyces sindenensis]|nr:hypothetical protein GCM10010231_29020 [Streptomyces sindenensis]